MFGLSLGIPTAVDQTVLWRIVGVVRWSVTVRKCAETARVKPM
jgi:hypothetical protein